MYCVCEHIRGVLELEVLSRTSPLAGILDLPIDTTFFWGEGGSLSENCYNSGSIDLLLTNTTLF